MYILRILIDKPLRLILTISGIALCIILILFILGIYNGVAIGSVEYVKQTNADLWVLQVNNNNIMRGTSILPYEYIKVFKRDSTIQSVTPVLLFFTNIKTNNINTTVLLDGFVPGSLGGPPKIFKGRNVINNNEIVLDKAFASKYKVEIGQSVIIHDNSLIVVGLSSGTNAFVTQYAFTSFNFTQSIIDLPGLTSFFIVKTSPGKNISAIKEKFLQKYPGIFSVYNQKDFLKNNIDEMQAGILPLFYAITAIGGIVLAIILSLILSVNILEKRKDYAIMKVIGSQNSFLINLILSQALIISIAAEIIGILCFFPLSEIIEYLAPEVSTIINIHHIIYITAIICVVTIVSSYFSSRYLKKIFPEEVFS